jgi:hypothetical protein
MLLFLLLAMATGPLMVVSCAGGSSSGGTGGSGMDGGTGTGGAISPGSGGFAASGGTSGTGGRAGTGGASAGTGGAATGGSAGGAGGASPGTGGGPAICSVAIRTITPEPREARPDAKVRVGGTLVQPSFAAGAVLSWKWTIRSATGGTVEPISPVGGDLALAEFSTPAAGDYTVRVDVDDQNRPETRPCASNPQPWRVHVDPPLPAALLFRVAAMPGRDLPAFDVVKIVPADPAPTVSLLAPSGQKVVLAPQDESALYLSAYVKISNADSSWSAEGHTKSRPLTVALGPQGNYTLLVIPEDPSVAPASQELRNPFIPAPLSSGVGVAGRVLDAAGQPVAGASVVLRAGDRPSTVGLSDADGAFAVLARPGVHTATIAAPASSGWPQARVAVSADGAQAVLVGSPPVPAPTLEFRFAPISVARVALQVRAAATGAPLARVRVALRSLAEAGGGPTVGTLVVTPGIGPVVSLPAVGVARFEGESDDAGRIVWPKLPLGRYRATVVPAAAGSGLAPALAVELVITGDADRAVDVPAPIMLAGTLRQRPGVTAAVAGGRVTAADRGADLPVPAAIAVADASGRFALAVGPGLDYQITVDPPAGALLPRGMLPAWNSETGPATLPAFEFPASLDVKGWISNPVSGQIEGALVEVFCAGGTQTCPDRSFAYAQAVTAADGSFRVIVPEAIAR